jgi:hypothetical protein
MPIHFSSRHFSGTRENTAAAPLLGLVRASLVARRAWQLRRRSSHRTHRISSRQRSSRRRSSHRTRQQSSCRSRPLFRRAVLDLRRRTRTIQPHSGMQNHAFSKKGHANERSNHSSCETSAVWENQQHYFIGERSLDSAQSLQTGLRKRKTGSPQDIASNHAHAPGELSQRYSRVAQVVACTLRSARTA